MTNTEKTNLSNISNEIATACAFRDALALADFVWLLSSPGNAGRPVCDALIVVCQDALGVYGWTEEDVEAAETLIETALN